MHCGFPAQRILKLINALSLAVQNKQNTPKHATSARNVAANITKYGMCAEELCGNLTN